MRSIAAVLAVALAAAAGTGCSDEDTTETDAARTTTAQATTTAPQTPPPTAPINRWARRADAVCRRFQQQIAAVPPPRGNEAGARRALVRALVPIRRQERRLKQLGPPDENRAIGLAFIGSIVSTRKSLEQVIAGLAAGDDAAVQVAYARAGAAGARTRTYARELGLVHCGAPRSG